MQACKHAIPSARKISTLAGVVMSIYSSQPSVREWPLPDKQFDPKSSEHIKALATRFGSPLFVIDLNVIRAQYRALKSALPMVDLHYALKPLPQVDVVQALKGLDASFDIATKGEIAVVRAAKVDQIGRAHV